MVDVRNKYVETTTRRISLSGLKNSSATVLPVGTVLFSSRATIGIVSIAKIELATNQGFKNFICDENKLIPEYLYYFLNYEAKRIEASCPGTTYKEISKSKIGKYTIPLPSLDDQKRIVNILDAADELRQKRKQVIGLLDDYLKSVFLEMFGDPLSNRKKLPMVKLEDVATKEKHAIVDGPFGSSLNNDDYLETGIPIIRINNVRDSGFYNDDFRYISEKKYNELIRSKVQYNDILIPRVGNSIGKVCIYNQRGKALLSTTGVAKVTIDPKIADLTFIVQQMRLPDYSKYIWNQTAERVNENETLL